MRRHIHQLLPLLLSLQHAATTTASGAGAAAPVNGQQQQQRQPGFSIHQDLLAYPQVCVIIPTVNEQRGTKGTPGLERYK